MQQLEELAQRILAELEEAGSNNIFALLNTIIVPKGEISEVDQFKIALSSLLPLGLVHLEMEGFFPRNPERLTMEQSLSLLMSLEQWFGYDLTTQCWKLREGDMRRDRFPVVHLSPAGRGLSEALLEDRGYQWWRQVQ